MALYAAAILRLGNPENEFLNEGDLPHQALCRLATLTGGL